MKKIVVAGSRGFNNYETAKEFIITCLEKENLTEPISFLSGGCRGSDLLGDRYAKEYGYPVEVYPAEWNRYGRGAGPIRNERMAEEADIIICFWDGNSKGTGTLLEYARRYNKTVYLKLIDNAGQM